MLSSIVSEIHEVPTCNTLLLDTDAIYLAICPRCPDWLMKPFSINPRICEPGSRHICWFSLCTYFFSDFIHGKWMIFFPHVSHDLKFLFRQSFPFFLHLPSLPFIIMSADPTRSPPESVLPLLESPAVVAT